MKLHYQCGLVLLLFCGHTFAADSVNLGVTGNIVASPCIFNGGGTSMDINLWDIKATKKATPGASSDSGPFKLLFTQGPAGTRSGNGSFTRSPGPLAGADYYMNSGSATNGAVAMREAGTGTLKGTGSSITQTIAADRTATMAMQASVKSVSGGATPGSISAVVVMTMQYN